MSRAPNRLAGEKSPYLLQHATNPVDWFPWGEAAFAKAREEGKPVFLSIGYSTCHWCHVMERESFEDEEVAALLNSMFVPVKVDREERPDVDRVYMTAMQAMGLGGGWPLNVFLTPELRPFFGGTYFPPRSLPGRIGMTALLPRVYEAWMDERDRVEETGRRVLEALASLDEPDGGAPDRAEGIAGCRDGLARACDEVNGGFGGAPKFPSPSNLHFLLRLHAAQPAGDARALAMAERQLDAMRMGGIHDHLGGGFHRYSTDARWLVPHFEKMLYDQAQIALAYLDAFAVTGRAEHGAAARGVLDYVARDLTSPQGGFWSAEDADSEGEEGRFYVWTPEEIGAALDPADARVALAHWGVTAGGNFEHGASILHERRGLEATARELGLAPAEASERLQRARAALLAARSRRPRPHLDDKILTAWNGLMISAFAAGARVLGDPALADRAARAAEFAWSALWDDAAGTLRRRWRDGEAAGAGQLDDHAALALGLIDLYRAGFDARWLERAARLAAAMVGRFHDPRTGAFFDGAADDPHLVLRMKSDHDGAEVAGNSLAAEVLLLLGRLLDRGDWLDLARGALDHYAARIRHQPAAMPRLVAAMLLEAAPARHVVIAGARDAAGTRALMREHARRFLPHDLLLLADEANAPALARLAPFTAPLAPRGGRAAAYVCVNHACRMPTTDPAEFAAQLDAGGAARVAPGDP
jgi:hypothetical protein